jgi:hypothetical protein
MLPKIINNLDYKISYFQIGRFDSKTKKLSIYCLSFKICKRFLMLNIPVIRDKIIPLKINMPKFQYQKWFSIDKKKIMQTKILTKQKVCKTLFHSILRCKILKLNIT